MNISKEQFDELKKNGGLAISLIGMSNIGKSYWSKKLAEIGFKRFCCDDIIESKLKPELQSLGYNGIEGVSKWMGQPYNDRFDENQKKYLLAETESLAEISNYLLINKKEEKVVIDITGSVVHTSYEICSALKEHSLIVYIEADENTKKKMFVKYLTNPKPVVWGDVFQPYAGETGGEALKRCYPELLKYRNILYARYADVTIPREEISYDATTEEFLEVIKKFL